MNPLGPPFALDGDRSPMPNESFPPFGEAVEPDSGVLQGDSGPPIPGGPDAIERRKIKAPHRGTLSVPHP